MTKDTLGGSQIKRCLSHSYRLFIAAHTPKYYFINVQFVVFTHFTLTLALGYIFIDSHYYLIQRAKCYCEYKSDGAGWFVR